MWLLTVFLTLADEDSRAAEARTRIDLLHVDDESHLLHLVKRRDELAEVVAALVDRERHQTRLLTEVAATNFLFALGVAQLNVRVAAGATERLLTDSCAIAHSDADAHCVSPSHGSRLRLRAADLQSLRRSVAKCPGKSSTGVYLRASRLADWRFSFTAVSGQEVSRASATGDVVHAREKSYAA